MSPKMRSALIPQSLIRDTMTPIARPRPTLAAVISTVMPAPASSRGRDSLMISKFMHSRPFPEAAYLAALASLPNHLV